MDPKVKTVFIIVVVILFLVGGYFVYSTLAKKSSASKTEAKFTEQGQRFQSGNQVFAEDFVQDPTKIDFGVAIYSGAKPIESKSAAENVELNSVKMTMALYQTSDSVDQVVSFYQRQLGANAITGQYVSDGVTYTVVKNKDNKGAVISVYNDKKTTKFVIVK